MLVDLDIAIKIIYVPLLDEGTSVARPAKAINVAGDIYVVLMSQDYEPEHEHWQYPPGSLVRCVSERRDAEDILLAQEALEVHLF